VSPAGRRGYQPTQPGAALPRNRGGLGGGLLLHLLQVDLQIARVLVPSVRILEQAAMHLALLCIDKQVVVIQRVEVNGQAVVVGAIDRGLNDSRGDEKGRG
jgi:hypothetical protein